MSVTYKRIYALLTQGSLSLTHEIGVDKTGDAKATKATLQALSDLIDSDIRVGIINEARKPSVHNVDNANYDILDDDGYNEIAIDPSGADRTATFPDPTHAINLNRKIKIRNSGDGSHSVLLAPFAAETFNVMSGNKEWTLASFELLQSGDWCEFICDGTNWIKYNEPYWHYFDDPATGIKTTKTAGWTADQFTPGGFEETYDEVPIGSIAIVTQLREETTPSNVYCRKSGDTNISNTPEASQEWTTVTLEVLNRTLRFILYLNDERKVEYAVGDILTDLVTYPPSSYLQ